VYLITDVFVNFICSVQVHMPNFVSHVIPVSAEKTLEDVLPLIAKKRSVSRLARLSACGNTPQSLVACVLAVVKRCIPSEGLQVLLHE